MTMQKQHYAQQVKMTALPGKRDELIQRLHAAIEALGHFPGCLYYLVSTTDEPDIIWICELWTSKEAKDALATSPETAEAMKALMPLIASTTDRTIMTVVDGFGL